MPVSKNRKNHKAKVAKRAEGKKERKAQYKNAIKKMVEARKAALEVKKDQEEQVRRNPTKQMFIQETKE